MSSSRNHAKRSHRSEKNKVSAFRSASTRNWVKQSATRTRRSIFARLFSRKAPERQQNHKQTNTNNNI